MNEETPRWVDEYTLLQTVRAENFAIVHEYHAAGTVAVIDPNLKSRLLNNFRLLVCETPSFKEKLLERGVSFAFEYYTETGEFEVRHEFSIEDCANDT